MLEPLLMLAPAKRSRVMTMTPVLVVVVVLLPQSLLAVSSSRRVHDVMPPGTRAPPFGSCSCSVYSPAARGSATRSGSLRLSA